MISRKHKIATCAATLQRHTMSRFTIATFLLIAVVTLSQLEAVNAQVWWPWNTSPHHLFPIHLYTLVYYIIILSHSHTIHTHIYFSVCVCMCVGAFRMYPCVCLLRLPPCGGGVVYETTASEALPLWSIVVFNAACNSLRFLKDTTNSTQRNSLQ